MPNSRHCADVETQVIFVGACSVTASRHVDTISTTNVTEKPVSLHTVSNSSVSTTLNRSVTFRGAFNLSRLSSFASNTITTVVPATISPKHVHDPSETPTGDISFLIPKDGGSRIIVDTRKCASVCPRDISAIQCYQYTYEVPPWTDDASYLSYECLVCLNAQVTLHAPDHYEVGNDQRETQHMIDAIWDISREAGMPP